MAGMKPDWRILYAITAAVLLTGLVLDLQSLYIAAKPLLMVMLLLYFLTSTRTRPVWRHLVTLALIFSWAGDVFLISPDWFVAGLASFFVAHVFYIAAYHKTGAGGGNLQPVVVLAFAVYGGFLLWFIYPGLDDLKVPVIAYALVLLGMGAWAFKRRRGTNLASFRLVATGAVLFVLSDSLIAVNRFANAVPAERILVMSIYLTAQYLIVQGLIQHAYKT
jgi:uncharacterized membrane protein YhhN